MNKEILTMLMKDMGDRVRGWLDERLIPIEQKLQALDEIEPVIGKDGAPGKDGEHGRDGRDGRDGKDGLDALDVSVLPAIDEAKSYSKGTWASHRGGLWVARKATDGMDGWECVVVGVAGAEIGFQGERDIECVIELSDGSRTVKSAYVPAVIDRGVYRPGMEAKTGDAVSCGGSLWVAQRDTQDKPGDADSGWRLAVKKGRDGKDGKDGSDGRDGLNGKSWTGKRVEQ